MPKITDKDVTTASQMLKSHLAYNGDCMRKVVAEAIAAERERCAKIVEGSVHREMYREWAWYGTGNRANESELVRFCDAAAKIIREG